MTNESVRTTHPHLTSPIKGEENVVAPVKGEEPKIPLPSWEEQGEGDCSPRANRSSQFHAIIWFLGFLIFYHLTISGQLSSPDEEVLFRVARAVALTGSSAVAPIQAGFATRQGLDGKQYAQYGLGQPLLAIPWYWLGRWWAQADPVDRSWFLPSPYHQHEQTWQAYQERFGVTLFNGWVSAALAALAGWCAARLWGNGHAGTWVALATGLGTMVWPYAKTFFSEPLAALFLLTAWACLVCLADLPHWVLLSGLAMGWAVLVRLDSLAFLPGFLFLACWAKPRPWLNAVLWLAPISLACGFLGWVNYERFGFIFSSGYSDQPEGIAFSTPLLEGLHGLLLSPGRSLFLYGPALVLAPYGWVRLARSRRRIVLGTVLAGVPFLLAMASWQNWEGGWCWGPRHIYQLTPLLALGIGWLGAGSFKTWTPWKRGLLWSWCVVSVFISGLGVSANAITAYAEILALVPESPHTRLQETLIAGKQAAQLSPGMAGQLAGQIEQLARQDSLYAPRLCPLTLHLRLVRRGQLDLMLVRSLKR